MARQNKSLNDIHDIKENLDTLKHNVIELTRHLRSNGFSQFDTLRNVASSQLHNIEALGQKQYKNLERHVAEKPIKSVAVALAAGAVLSFLLARRRKD